MKNYDYFSTRTFILSIVIVIFTILAISFYSKIEPIFMLIESLVVTCGLLSVLVNLEIIMQYSKHNRLYENITKAICLCWYALFTVVAYKYILTP